MKAYFTDDETLVVLPENGAEKMALEKWKEDNAELAVEYCKLSTTKFYSEDDDA